MLLEFPPGQLAPSLTLWIDLLRVFPGCFPLCHLTDFLPSIQQCPRQHILGITPGIRFLGNPFIEGIGWNLLA
jgi:hypothetical protein